MSPLDFYVFEFIEIEVKFFAIRRQILKRWDGIMRQVEHFQIAEPHRLRIKTFYFLVDKLYGAIELVKILFIANELSHPVMQKLINKFKIIGTPFLDLD